MAVIHMEEAQGDNSASADLTNRKYTALVRCTTDDAADTGHTVLQYMIANGYGYRNSWSAGNDSNANAIITGIDPPQLIDGSCFKWETTVHYETIVFKMKDTSDGIPTTPVDVRPKITTRTIPRQVPVDKATYRSGFHADVGLTDGDESPVINSAGAVYVPAPTRARSNRLITIKRGIAAITIDEATLPTDWINSDAFTISDRQTTITVGAYELISRGWSTEPTEQEGIDFVMVTGEFELQKGGWRQEFLDRGITARAKAGDPDGKGGTVSASDIRAGMPEMRRIADLHGNPIGEPVNLDGNGQPLDVGDPPVYSLWSLEDETDVSVLSFFTGIVS